MGDLSLPLPGFIALDWSLVLFSLLFVILRLWVRTRRKIHSVASNISDLCVVLSWISAIIFISINTWKNVLRMGYLGQENLYYGVPMEMSAHLLMISWFSLFWIYISLWLAKAAFIAFYYDLFTHLGKRCRIIMASVAVFTAGTFVLHMILLALWCRPVNLNWDINGNLCSAVHDMNSVTISTFSNVTTDLLIILLPIIVLKNLTFRRAEAYGWLFIVFIGSISILAAIIRYGALKAVWGQPKASVTHTIDVWALVEIVASILAVCLPACRVFFRGKKKKDVPRPGDGMKNMENQRRKSSGTGRFGNKLYIIGDEEEGEEEEEEAEENHNHRREEFSGTLQHVEVTDSSSRDIGQSGNNHNAPEAPPAASRLHRIDLEDNSWPALSN